MHRVDVGADTTLYRLANGIVHDQLDDLEHASPILLALSHVVGVPEHVAHFADAELVDDRIQQRLYLIFA